MDVTAPPEPTLIEARFEQDEDTASPRSPSSDFPYQHITVETNDGNGRDQRYYAISTERWAFNDVADLVQLLKRAGVE